MTCDLLLLLFSFEIHIVRVFRSEVCIQWDNYKRKYLKRPHLVYANYFSFFALPYGTMDSIRAWKRISTTTGTITAASKNQVTCVTCDNLFYEVSPVHCPQLSPVVCLLCLAPLFLWLMGAWFWRIYLVSNGFCKVANMLLMFHNFSTRVTVLLFAILTSCYNQCSTNSPDLFNLSTSGLVFTCNIVFRTR